jgi:hypothetical protein
VFVVSAINLLARVAGMGMMLTDIQELLRRRVARLRLEWAALLQNLAWLAVFLNCPNNSRINNKR